VEFGGKRPTFLSIYTAWFNNGKPITFADVALRNIQTFRDAGMPDAVPLLSWEAYSDWGQNTNPNYRGITTKDIAAGKLDGYVHDYARDVRAYGSPVFIRPICQEMNGAWYYNCSPHARPGVLTAADFVSAWRRVVDIFRAEGVTNVAWVWNPNTWQLPRPP